MHISTYAHTNHDNLSRQPLKDKVPSSFSEKQKQEVLCTSGVPVLVDLEFAFYAGNRGLDSHRDTFSTITFSLINHAGTPRKVLPELE